jgi:UDP-N-acetylmuramyl pentapeptide synthase
VGGLAREIAGELEKYGVWVKSFDNNPQAVRYILENPDIGNTIFLKASRSMKFEEIIEGLKGRFS